MYVYAAVRLIRIRLLSSWHYNDVIMSKMASQITSLTIVYSTVYSGADQRKHQSSASLAFVRGIYRWPVAQLPSQFFPAHVPVFHKRQKTLQWRHNGRDSVSNHQPHHCLLNRLFRRRSKETSKLRVTGLCAGNSPGTGEFPAQMASNADKASIWWRHQESKLKQRYGCRGYSWKLRVKQH